MTAGRLMPARSISLGKVCRRRCGITEVVQPASWAALARCFLSAPAGAFMTTTPRQQERGAGHGVVVLPQQQDAGVNLADVVIDGDQAFGVKFSERNKDGPLFVAQMAQAVDGQVE